MMTFAFQLYLGFVLLQGAFMKSIQNTTDHAFSIASLKSAVDRLEERIENMSVIQVFYWMDFINAPWSRTNPRYNWKANVIIFTLDRYILVLSDTS
jgi:hypothetical protein